MRNLLFVPVKRLLGLFIGLLLIVGVGFKGQTIASFLYTDLHFGAVFPPQMIVFTIYFLSLAGILLISLYTERDKTDAGFKAVVKPYAAHGNLSSMIAFGILFYLYYNSLTSLTYYYLLAFSSLFVNGIIAYFMELKIKEYDDSLNGNQMGEQIYSQDLTSDNMMPLDDNLFGTEAEQIEEQESLTVPPLEIEENFSNTWVGSYIYPNEDFLKNFRELSE